MKKHLCRICRKPLSVLNKDSICFCHKKGGVYGAKDASPLIKNYCGVWGSRGSIVSELIEGIKERS